jgi:hypothetical protein
MIMLRSVLVLVCTSWSLGSMATEPALRDAQWVFAVTLDGKPIGQHRFVLERVRSDDASETDAWRLTSRAEYDVKLLGISVYRYRHQAEERWQGDCLAGLSADTNDGGARTHVDARAEGATLRVEVTSDKARHHDTLAASGRIMTYAYWHPALRRSGNGPTQLLNPQNGRLEAVRIVRLGAGRVSVHGREEDAIDWRIESPGGPIDVWYDAGGQWLGLDAVVSGQRKLSYRLP